MDTIQVFENWKRNEWMKAQKKRTEKDGTLDEQIVQNFRSVEKYVWQDEKNCTFEVPFN